MPVPSPIVGIDVPDHVAAATSRLCEQFKTKPNIKNLLATLVAPAQALENALWQLLTQRTIDQAIGVQLDALGTIVGRPRDGVTDDEIYRRYVRAQISVNKSHGSVEDILTIARLVVNDARAALIVRNEGVAAFTLIVVGVAMSDAVAAVLIKLTIRAAAAGVRPILVYAKAAPDNVGHWTTRGTWGSAVWARAIDKEI